MSIYVTQILAGCCELGICCNRPTACTLRTEWCWASHTRSVLQGKSSQSTIPPNISHPLDHRIPRHHQLFKRKNSAINHLSQSKMFHTNVLSVALKWPTMYILCLLLGTRYMLKYMWMIEICCRRHVWDFKVLMRINGNTGN